MELQSHSKPKIDSVQVILAYFLTERTIQPHLRRVNSFFTGYCRKYYPDKTVELFDRRAGRPVEFLRDGWDMWRETKRFFVKKLGFRLSE
jgi:hypothetical protein